MHQYRTLQLTVSANTPQSSPASASWSLYPGWVHSFRVSIPRGHSGLTGVRLVYQGTPIIPFDPSAFLIGNGQTFEIPFNDQVMSTGLQVQAFNTDAFPHTFYLWADNDPYQAPGRGREQLPAPAAPPSAAQLAALAALGVRR